MKLLHALLWLTHLASAAAERDGPWRPTRKGVMEMNAGQTALAIANHREAEVAIAVVERMAELANGSRAAQETFVKVAGGRAVPALLHAIDTHQHEYPELAVDGLGLLHALSTGFGDMEWKESDAGIERCGTLVEHGVIESAVRAMKHAGFDEGKCLGKGTQRFCPGERSAWDIQRLGANLIGSVCFGNDGEDHIEFGDPQEIAARRQRAAEAGAIEALVEVIRVHGVRRPSTESDERAAGAQRADLDAAARSLGWVLAGTDADGDARRERAASLQLIPLALLALDRFFSPRLADQISWLLSKDEARLDLLNSEVRKRPGLLEKITQLTEARQETAQEAGAAEQPAGGEEACDASAGGSSADDDELEEEVEMDDDIMKEER